jgi:hypothetical protein
MRGSMSCPGSWLKYLFAPGYKGKFVFKYLKDGTLVLKTKTEKEISLLFSNHVHGRIEPSPPPV